MAEQEDKRKIKRIPSLKNYGGVRTIQRSILSIERRTVKGGDKLSPPKMSILSIERRTVKESYWDLQVLDTNNYVTIDGAIHHNSGKSYACAAEVMMRAVRQKPSPRDGIRYTRFVIVRNSYPELKTTTIKTWQELFPENTFGPMLYTPPITHHIRLPSRGDAAGIDCEVIFLALGG